MCNTFQRNVYVNVYQNTFSIYGYAIENICKMAAIVSRPRYVEDMKFNLLIFIKMRGIFYIQMNW